MESTTKYGILAALAAGVAFNPWLEGWNLCLFLVILWISYNSKSFYLLYHTLGRDLRMMKNIIRLGFSLKKAEWQNLTVPKMFAQTVKRSPNKIMFHFEGATWTFQQVEDYSNQVANYFLNLGYSKGQEISEGNCGVFNSHKKTNNFFT